MEIDGLSFAVGIAAFLGVGLVIFLLVKTVDLVSDIGRVKWIVEDAYYGNQELSSRLESRANKEHLWALESRVAALEKQEEEE